MIISDKHKYVFIEMPRSGSRAVATELVDLYDGHEILVKHATYRDFLKRASAEQRNYFSFSTVRNPLDVAVTRYAHLRANKDNRFTDPRQVTLRGDPSGKLERRIHQWVVRNDADFESFLRHWYWVPYDTWTCMDHRRMDMVMRTETLADDFAEALRRIGIQPIRPLPVRNATPGKAGRFEDWYAPRAIRRAAWVFGPYMQEWGYEFPEYWGNVTVPWWSTVFLRVARIPRLAYWKYFRYSDHARSLARVAAFGPPSDDSAH